MRSIKLMDKSLAEKIAAGEVVERPGSIVKELCENSIDAGSTAITIEIKSGGISYIRIIDNGHGISADEVELAFQRHSTSKMYSLQELEQIEFLGFRGEALASIAAVSEVCMITKTKNSDYGRIIEISGGEIKALKEVGCSDGTNITVENLFFNTPARRKFLKKASVEAAYIGDIVSRLILAYPAISFKFVSDGRIVLHSPGTNKLSDAVISVYGRFVSDNMLQIEYKSDAFSFNGLIGNSELEKNNKSYQSVFINGRYVKDRIVSSAVSAGYLNNLTVGKFPMFILFFDMSGNYVDVNVHPNKLEVRFSDEKLIYDAIRDTVARSLSAKNEIPPLMPQIDENVVAYKTPTISPYRNNDTFLKNDDTKVTVDNSDFIDILKPQREVKPITLSDRIGSVVGNISVLGVESEPKVADEGTKEQFIQENAEDFKLNEIAVVSNGSEASVVQNVTNNKDEVEESEQLTLINTTDSPEQNDILADYRIIGQAFATYVLVENHDTLYLIDQHAAHERLLYERLVKSVENGSVISQNLLTPQKLSVNFSENTKLISILDELTLLGFEIEEFGDNEYLIRSVPVLMNRPCGVELIKEILGDYDRLRSCKAIEIKRQKLMQTACKHAIKAGDKLLPEELDSIMKMIKEENVPLSCPHGRPILVSITKKELELRFKRIQS